MKIVPKIICKTVGIAGMSAVIYDAYTLGNRNSQRTKLMVNADHFEKVHYSTRNLTNESALNRGIQKKVANLRMENPLFSVYGSAKGFIKGFLDSLGNNIIPVTFAALALAGKNTVSKIGAIGVAGYGLFTILHEGFGVGKSTPID